MESKKQIKISLKTIIILIIAFVLVVGVSIFIYNTYYNKTSLFSYKNKNSVTIYSNSENEIKGKEIEYNTKVGWYDGTSNCIENAFISSYKEFKKYINKFGEVTIENENVLEIFNEEFFENHTVAIEAHDATTSNNSYNVESVRVDGTEVNISINLTTSSYGGIFEPIVQFRFIILDKNIKSARFIIKTTEKNNIWDLDVSYKPIIYLYPTQNTKVLVKLRYNENITVSYPKYLSGWNVLAKTDGTLTELTTNRNLYALYYECKNIISFKEQAEGFVVKGEDSARFLEEKLAVLGLTEREAQEFIIYWLPQLESNKYNYIRFATDEEINNNMPLEINPNPDTIIRVLMTFKGLKNPIEVEEQKLDTPERKGFTVVEWGGTEIK